MKQQSATWHYKKSLIKFLESAQNKTYTILGLTFIALIIFGAFAIRPTITTIIKLNKKVQEGQALNTKMQAKIDALSSLQKKIYDNEKSLNLSESAFPEDPKIDSIIANADLIAQKYDLQLIALTPGDIPEPDEAKEFGSGILTRSMRITLEGNRENFQKFLNHMETLPREIYITRVSVTEEDDETTENNILMAEILYFYYGK